MSPIIQGARRIGARLGMGEDKFCYSEYDFAVDGGAAGSIPLRGDIIPSGALITQAIFQVDTVLSGGTGTDTLAITVESAADLQAATARNAALPSPWSTTGPKWASNGTHGGSTVTQPFATSQIRTPTLVISNTALTQGKFRLAVEYIEF